MDGFPHSLRQSPRLILHRLSRTPQARLYTKETLQRRRRRASDQAHPSRHAIFLPKAKHQPNVPEPIAFGKPRNAASKAAKAQRSQESRRVEKALQHQHHGESVYAYAHLGTGQVVYSLSRVMDNNQVLRQLVFHGKKTVPAALRRDMWTPYFSLHFPSSYSGLLAYHKLRELSLQRQLQPPDYLVKTSTQSASKERRENMTREEEEKWDEEHEGKEHPDGVTWLARRADRAKTLMMQKATSVADVAFVVDLLRREGHLLSPESVQEMLKARQEERLQKQGKGQKKKLLARLEAARSREQRYQSMVKEAQEGTKWGLDGYAAKRISVEFGGAVVNSGMGSTTIVLPGGEAETKDSASKVTSQDSASKDLASENLTQNIPPSNAQAAAAAAAASIEPSPKQLDAISKNLSLTLQPLTPHLASTSTTDPSRVLILWSDLRDASYASSWPDFISHGELERMATTRVANGQGQTFLTGRSVHVIGGMRGRMGLGSEVEEGWMRGRGAWDVPWKKERRRGRGTEGVQGRGEEVEEETGAGKSREEQTNQLASEGVVLNPSAQRRGVFGWLKGRLGIAA